MSRNSYELTKLAFADIVQYETILKELKSERKYRKVSYKYARSVIKEYHQSENDTDILLDAIAEYRDLEDSTPDKNQVVLYRNNAEVLEGYLKYFSNPFRKFSFELPQEFSSYSINFNQLRITGKPHLVVKNCRSKDKFLYILSAKDWSDEQKAFFVSLIGEIVSHNVTGVNPIDVEGLDCRTGKRITRKRLSENHRNRVNKLANHLVQNNLG